MESEELAKLISDCPLLIRLNDGREYFVEKPEFITVGDYTSGILYDDNGVKRNAVIAIMNITTVIPHAPSPKTKRRRKTS
jgi:hypothetical protein